MASWGQHLPPIQWRGHHHPRGCPVHHGVEPGW
ncbi:hypothetical protein LINPERPRIM_LOCUS23925 [Linum perenne]